MGGTWKLGLVVVCLAVACSDGNDPTAVRLDPAEASLSSSDGGDGATVRFDRLAGNQGPFVGAAGAIRGINAGGLPWALERGEARLDADGELRVEVEGLVLDPVDERVPPARRGINPVAAFRAVLSCETFDETGRTVVNLATEPVATDAEGDATIRQKLSGIPSPCYAPIVFVTSGTGAAPGSWFAVSAF